MRADVSSLTEWVNARFRATVYEDAFSPFCLIAGDVRDADVIHADLDDYCRRIPNLVVVRKAPGLRKSPVVSGSPRGK